MAITDELRSFIKDPLLGYASQEQHVEQLTAIADRIDEALAERYIELPKDADGEYIHIGDRMENNERVARIVLTDDSWEPSVYLEKLPNVLHEHFCNEISHYHAPTVEDVLLDMHRKLSDVSELYDVDSDELEEEYTRIIAEYAAKLRLAGSDAE